MSLQLLTQVYAPAANAVIKRTDNQDETKNLYAQYNKGGILLFLRVAEITNPDARFVYFMVYSMFPKITVYWGVFDKDRNDFIFDSGCVGNLKTLNVMLTKWKEHGYQYTSNIVQNQITPLISKYLKITPKKGKISFDYSLYSLFRRVINGIDNKYPINDDDLINFKIVIFDTFIKDPEFHYTQDQIGHVVRLYEYQIDKMFNLKRNYIENQMHIYENDSNLLSINSDLNMRYSELSRITKIFFEKIKHGEYFYYNRVTDMCPTIDECNIKNQLLCGAYEYGYNISYVEDIL